MVGKRELAAVSLAEAEGPRARLGALDGRGPARAGDGPARAGAARWLARLAPAQLPPGVLLAVDDDQSKWYRIRRGLSPLTAVLEIDVWQGEPWAHLALTGRNDLPTLAELGWCRDLFFGDRRAIQILPRRCESAEAGLRTLHLYAQLERDALPSFDRPASHVEREERG